MSGTLLALPLALLLYAQEPAPLPQIQFSASADSVELGQSIVLIWEVSNADSVRLEPGVGSVGARDCASISPIESTTYTLSAMGPGGTVVHSYRFRVVEPTGSTAGAVV